MADIAVLHLVLVVIAVLARRRLSLGSMLAQQLIQIAASTHQLKARALLGDPPVSQEDDVVALWGEVDRMRHEQPCSRAQESMRPNHAVEQMPRCTHPMSHTHPRQGHWLGANHSPT